jgi:5-formyltetrahydrofolate cyclo-ligase
MNWLRGFNHLPVLSTRCHFGFWSKFQISHIVAMPYSQAMLSKQQLRLEQRRKRDSLPDISSRVCAVLLPWLEAQGARTVLAYKAFDSEISLETLVVALPQIRFLTTRVYSKGSLTLHDFALATQKNKYGILEPSVNTVQISPELVDVALVPGLAFTIQGGRLGYGGGFYDRLLPQLRSDCALVGVTRAGLLLPELPLEEFDVPMAFLALETGVKFIG